MVGSVAGCTADFLFGEAPMTINPFFGFLSNSMPVWFVDLLTEPLFIALLVLTDFCNFSFENTEFRIAVDFWLYVAPNKPDTCAIWRLFEER